MTPTFVSKILIPSVVCVTLMAAPIIPVVAQTASRDEQIEALSATLLVIGEAIRTATTLTDEDRLALYTQLVTLSNAIVALRMAEVGDPILASVEEDVLTRLILKYDYDEPTTVMATTTFASSSPETYTFNYPKLLEYSTFSKRMSAIRQFGTYDISLETATAQNAVRRLTYISARNPVRDGAILKNSSQAEALIEDFGVYSIITNIDIFPGDGTGRIEIKSDQKEILIIEVTEVPPEGDPSEHPEGSGKYTYHYTFMITDKAFNTLSIPAGFVTDDEKSIGVDNIDVATKNEIIEVLVDLFGKHPLASEIEDYDDKLFEFLLENKTIFLVDGHPGYYALGRNCYDPADVLVMKELAGSLLATMKVQQDLGDKSFTLQAPIVTSKKEGPGGFSCGPTKHIF